MQEVSQNYKEVMKRKWINLLCHMRVNIGVVNQVAQSSAQIVNAEACEYYSDLQKPLNNYTVSELYVACDENYTKIDNGMYFLPRDSDEAVLNQGIVTRQVLGIIEFIFPVQQDIKGLTIDFGSGYPEDFIIETDTGSVAISGNTASRFVTEEVFERVTFLRLVPSKMKNGQGRLRIHQIIMGAGIYFSGHEIKSANKQEYVSPISEELPTIDFSLAVENRNRKFDIENEESAVNFLEIGQSIEALYGQELDDGSIEWVPGINLLLTEWSVDDDEMYFAAADRFAYMNDTYYGGKYYPEGISLYDLAEDVLLDAKIDLREVWLDPYLKSVIVHNPMPVVKHKEALQLIANAGRCILTHGRNGNIYLKSSFSQTLTAESDNAAYFSSPETLLNGVKKTNYALTSLDYTVTDKSMYFLPRENEGAVFLDSGYVSEKIADENGMFSENPTVSVLAEAAYKCFGVTLEFGRKCPKKVKIFTYYEDELVEEYQVPEISQRTVCNHEFAEWDRMVLEFQEGTPHNRIVLHNIIFGESTDYVLEYGRELKKTPKGKQLQKVKEVQVVRTIYSEGQVTDMELAKEKVIVTEQNKQHTFYLNNPSYGFSSTLTEPEEGQSVQIIASGSYFVTVEFVGVDGEVEVTISGREYIPSYARVSRQLNSSGIQEVWENPLISEQQHAEDLAEWIGDYLKSNKEYEISYRGDARIDANDLVFLENRYVEDMRVRIYKHTLNYNGALSGSITARRVE